MFLDLDGTLVTIAATPETAQPAPGLLPLLECLGVATDGALALISGRALASIDAMLAPLRLPAAGLHGAERRRADGSIVSDRAPREGLDRLRPLLLAAVAAEPGLRLEDKGGSLALHYRLVPEQGPALRRLAQSIAASEPGLRVIDGRKVVEFQPLGMDKGRAIAAFLAEPPFAGRTPIFAGDDATDEDGFAEVERRGGMSIRIANAEATSTRATSYRLPSVAALHRWLKNVADALAAERGPIASARPPLLATAPSSAKWP